MQRFSHFSCRYSTWDRCWESVLAACDPKPRPKSLRSLQCWQHLFKYSFEIYIYSKIDVFPWRRRMHLEESDVGCWHRVPRQSPWFEWETRFHLFFPSYLATGSADLHEFALRTCGSLPFDKSFSLCQQQIGNPSQPDSSCRQGQVLMLHRFPAEPQSMDKRKGKVFHFPHFCQRRMQWTPELWRRPAAVSVTNHLWKDQTCLSSLWCSMAEGQLLWRVLLLAGQLKKDRKAPSTKGSAIWHPHPQL